MATGDIYNFTVPQQGWQCPCCRRVYSPTTVMCWFCPASTSTTSGSSESYKCAHGQEYNSCEFGCKLEIVGKSG